MRVLLVYPSFPWLQPSAEPPCGFFVLHGPVPWRLGLTKEKQTMVVLQQGRVNVEQAAGGCAV